MLNPRELYTFLESFQEMCRNYPECKGCELLVGDDCHFVGCGGGTVEEMENIILTVERWKTKREKEIAKRELEEFVAQLAKELKGSMKIENGALVIEGSGAGEIKFKLGGAE